MVKGALKVSRNNATFLLSKHKPDFFHIPQVFSTPKPKQDAAPKKLRQSKNNNLSPVTPNAEHDFSQICANEANNAGAKPSATVHRQPLATNNGKI